MLGDLQYPMAFGGEVHYPVGFLWKSESELLGAEAAPTVKTPATFEEWVATLLVCPTRNAPRTDV